MYMLITNEYSETYPVSIPFEEFVFICQLFILQIQLPRHRFLPEVVNIRGQVISLKINEMHANTDS